MYQFDQETLLSQPNPDNPGSHSTGHFSGHFTGQVFPQWNIGSNPNGGYLAALAVTALQQALPQHADPLSVTVHYLRPGLAGQPCEVKIDVLRTGQTLSTVRASVVQDGKARLEVLACMGTLAQEPLAPLPQLSIPMPDIPPPAQCVGRSAGAQGVQLPILDRLDILLHPDEARLGATAAAGKAQVTGWLRFQDGRPPDALACLLFADAFPPAIFGLLGMVGWVPTLELTVQVRRRPSPGWMLGRFTCNDLNNGPGGGLLVEDGVLWDAQGHLVAQSRQLALVRTNTG